MLDEKSLTAEELRNAVARISNDPAYYVRTLQMHEEIQKAGGYIRAADVLQDFVKLLIK
jgi:UDP:flavonoid glycosyltransferase YjiC (YdhE family)